MNEQIKELAAQAKFIAEETIDRKISKNAELDAFAEKFAELIVQECAKYAEHNLDMAGYKKKFMLKHFGVEEN